ncbi:MAG TPA: luciferase family protein [Reyranella sp.]|nr:luciferase family protein [Reyranella sp.]
MANQALSTLPRRAKGPMAPPPALAGKLKAVADAVAAWPDVEATTHWRFDQPNRVDGVDFYVGSDELGHIHLDGSIHLATTPRLGAELVTEGAGQPFMWARGWTTASIHRLGVDRSVALFRRNYDRLRTSSE